EPVNPFFGIHAAVTRQDRKDEPPNGWRSEEAMSLREALRAFTLDAAFAAKSESLYGSLEPGKKADFILIDRDPFEIPPSELDDIQVIETWVEGKKVYHQEGSRP
ncbi:MAG TPA: amidohydrolase, partial [Bacteroidetes bacterium]|nr:amidohydrolase [Bacteroidota bacterium]